MDVESKAPTPLIRVLIRVLCLLCAISGLLSAQVLSAMPIGSGRWAPHRPIFCDVATRIVVDFLQDGIQMPRMLDSTSGELAPGQVATFKLLAISDNRQYYANLTTETHAIRVRARGARGEDVSGDLYYTTASNEPRFVFAPHRTAVEDRIVFLDFAYGCRAPDFTLKTQFVLTLRGTGRAGSAATVEAGSTQSVREAEPPGGSAEQDGSAQRVRTSNQSVGADLAVRITGPSGPVTEEAPVSFRVELTNRGAERVTDASIGFRITDTLSLSPWPLPRGTARWGVREGYSYSPGELGPGETVTLNLRGAALFSGAAKLEASCYGAKDPDPTNNRDQVVLSIAPAPRPDLTGRWEPIRVTETRSRRGTRLQLSGTVRVSNNGQTDAGPTRLALFSSADGTLGPEDELLGFRDVPSLPAGASVSLDVEHEVGVPRSFASARLIALVDAPNNEYEGDEGNNRVLSAPAR